MDADTLRSLIAGRIDAAGLTTHHAAALAGVPDQTARDYLAGRSDLSAGRVLRLLSAVGLRVAVTPDPRWSPPPAPRPGRAAREIIPGKPGG